MAKSRSQINCRPSHFVIVLALMIAVLSLTRSAQAQGRLSQVRSAVKPKPAEHKPPKKQNPRPSSNQNEHNHDNDHHDDDHRNDDHHNDQNRRKKRPSYRQPLTGSFWLSTSSTCEPSYQPAPVIQVYNPPIAPAVTPAPFIPPVAPILLTNEVPAAPIVYEEAYISDANADCPPMEIGLDWFQSWCFRGSVIGGGGDDDLTFAGLSMLAIQPQGLGLDVSVKTWRENSSLARDHLWLGDANVVYEFANHGDVRARVGLGVNWLADAYLADAGFNLTTGIDLRLTENWLLDLEGDVGTIGSADFLHGQISLARRFNTSELTVGYDYYDIGGAELSGFFAGLQFRF